MQAELSCSIEVWIADEYDDGDELTEVSSIEDAGSLGSAPGEESGSLGGLLRPRVAGDTASVASTWRPERTDRNAGLSFIDER